MAFAATLDRLGLPHWERLTGIVSFNLGIETMQAMAVAVVLPSLILLSRTRGYTVARTGGAVLAGLASLGWILQRLLGVQTPMDTIVSGVAAHAFAVMLGLFAVSLAIRYFDWPAGHDQKNWTVLAGTHRRSTGLF